MKRDVCYLMFLLLAAFTSCGWEDPLAGLAGPEHEVIKPKTRGFTVMSYNIFGARGLKYNEDYEALASVIRYAEPDFVLLQEVDSCTTRQGELQCLAAAKLVEILDTTTIYKWHYNFSLAEERVGGKYGDAILSRHPILWKKNYQMDYAPEHADHPEREKRSVGIIKTLVDTTEVYIGCTHFDHIAATEHGRIRQAHQLRTIVEEYDGEILVLGGDLNATPDSETMSIVTEYLTPSYTDEKQYTFKGSMTGTPMVMIDYVMLAKYSEGIVCTSSNVIDSNASDHNAVYATYVFSKE